jgi:hypothetical protein
VTTATTTHYIVVRVDAIAAGRNGNRKLIRHFGDLLPKNTDRWKAFSLAMGDREDNWHVKPFQMSPGGPFWVPPPLPTVSSDCDEERAKEQLQEQEWCGTEVRERESAGKKDGTIIAKGDKDKDTTGATTVYVHVCDCVSTVSKLATA